ncbi:MAG TPA: poly(3-hydroxyalkanoate) depolymerase, partial [Novosphingobium sp.]|nr:poly(3-hydroxyalkanoate) depolymerase [Novosphingobium sp.]
QHGDCVRKLVLAATTAGMFMVPGNPPALSKMANPRRYIDAAFMEKHFRTLYGGLTGDKEEHISRLTPPTPRGYFYQLLAMLGWTSAPALPFLKKEVLIMMGEDDQIVPLTNGKILETLIPNSRLEIFEQGGHLFMLTHREQTISSLRGFLDAPARKERKAA